MISSWLHTTGLTALAVTALLPGQAQAAWTRTYAIDWNEPAMYFAGLGNPVEPGPDCPRGANPDPDWRKIMMRGGYTPEQIKWLFDRENRQYSAQRFHQMAFRGKDWANVYADPTTSPDSGFMEVAGKVGEGINLDGDPRTGFVSPAGEKGVDNRFYKALGCWKFYRGAAGESPSFVTANNRMRDGGWTMVVVVSGAGDDPMNDDQVRMGVFMSADTLVKDGTGNVAKDYTFRIRPHADYEALFEGKIANGRLTTAATPRAFLRDAGFGRGLELLQARADLQLQPDGMLKGYVGGYRPFQAIFEGFLDHHGWTIESNTGVELPALWYALRRNADYSPTGPLGPKTHISFALRVQAAPAYVTDPKGQGLVSGVRSYRAAAPAGEGLMRYPPRPPGYRVVDGLVTPASGAPAAPLTAEELAHLAAQPGQVATKRSGHRRSPVSVSARRPRLQVLEPASSAFSLRACAITVSTARRARTAAIVRPLQ